MSAHTELDATIDHEEVVIRRGERTGQPVIVAVHNTKLGPGLGGVRLTKYDSSVSAVVDALRLSRAMTFKAAASNNGTGGGKSVVPLLPGGPQRVDGQFRTSLLLDVADVVHSLGFPVKLLCSIIGSSLALCASRFNGVGVQGAGSG